MSRIEEMIRELCPNGIEFKRIGEIAECYAGATPKTTVREFWDNGTIPWMSSGEVNYGEVFTTEKKITQLGYDKSSTKLVPPNTVVIALAGQGKTRGTVAITRIELCTNQSLCSIVTNDSLNSDFLYHYLRSRYQDLRQISSGDGTRGGLNLKMIANYVVPIPPLAIQNEIVNILDKFTELEAELEARRKQYEYYRNKLLTFNEITPPQKKGEVKWLTMSEVCNIYSGKNKTKNAKGLYPVYGSTGIIAYCDKYVYNARQILIARVGANAGYIHIANGKYDVSDNTLIIDIKDNYNLQYIYYILVYMNLKRYAKGGGQPLITAGEIKQLQIPIPPLAEQERIVAILDKFETLVNDISEGLPAEIAARRQQYEYYRDKLLTFKRKEDGKIQPRS